MPDYLVDFYEHNALIPSMRTRLHFQCPDLFQLLETNYKFPHNFMGDAHMVLACLLQDTMKWDLTSIRRAPRPTSLTAKPWPLGLDHSQQERTWRSILIPLQTVMLKPLSNMA